MPLDSWVSLTTGNRIGNLHPPKTRHFEPHAKQQPLQNAIHFYQQTPKEALGANKLISEKLKLEHFSTNTAILLL